ncbi:MAG TPA: metal-dependent hydrolase [Erysipelotrichaceae bacterium]|nr:metal-dependent hydrolase [Erysipelotrichaceae bacterium]
MVIDFHTHTFPDRIAERALASLSKASRTFPFTDGTNDGLLASMKTSGIDLSVILPIATNPGQVEKINGSAAGINSLFPGKLISVGCMHPMYEDWYDELSRIRDLGLKGIKIHPVYQGVDIDDPLFIRILKRCAELDLFVITHAGKDIGFPGVDHCSVTMIRHAIEETGPFRFILAHMGGWKEWEDVPSLADTGVWLDTAFSTDHIIPADKEEWEQDELAMLDQDTFMHLVKIFTPEKILFGTDSPWSDQKASLDWIRKLPLAENEREMILHENAENILGIH